ncbi:hypothetical protein CsSME_00027046 [Camellia sinensis var. sinensis]
MIPPTLFILIIHGGSVYCERPSVVNVGAIFSFDSVIGRVAKATMEAAASAINADPRILSGTELKLIMEVQIAAYSWGLLKVTLSSSLIGVNCF